MYRIAEDLPGVDEFRALRASVGWGSPSPEECGSALAATVVSVVARHGERAVGMARAVGDGSMYLFVVDVVVHPDHQGAGLGHRMVDALVDAAARHGTRSLLLVAEDKVVPFYEAHGFSTESNRVMRHAPAVE